MNCMRENYNHMQDNKEVSRQDSEAVGSKDSRIHYFDS